MSGPYPNDQGVPGGAIPGWIVPGVAGTGFTPRAANASSITTGGTAVSVVTGLINGGYILNPLTAAAQKIVTAENLYIDFINTPGSTDATGNGTTLDLQPGQGYAIPAISSGVTLKANAATSGHAFTVYVW